jgi:alkanesulfonate monooxygenase SsuD/methylene tetrahydromethanopterin reductase-like flavin-dependent oxidoreductase (luciferase family)
MAFISLFSFDATVEVTNDIRTRAAQFGRTVKCCTYPFVVWRETEREADECFELLPAHQLNDLLLRFVAEQK